MNLRRIAPIACLWAALAVSAGCHLAHGRPRTGPVLEATGEALLEPARPGMLIPSPRWDRAARATGTGFPAPDAPSDQLRRLTAVEAARHVALARLVEQLEGARVSQSSRVRNMIFAGQEVESATSGDLNGARVVDVDYDDSSGVANVTVLVGLDEDGRPVPAAQVPATPLSLPARRVRAEAAARMNALARLSERLGDLHVKGDLRVREVQLRIARSGPIVERILDGAELGRVEWVSRERCRVEARLRVAPEELEQLRELPRGGDT